MDKLFDKVWHISDTPVYEFDIKKSLRTAAVTGLIGAGAAGLGLARAGKEEPVKPDTKPAVTAPKEVSKEPEEITKEEPKKEVLIDMKKIASIESSNNPDTPDSPAGARGLHQIMKSTWEEMVSKMGKDWSWEEAHDADKNTAVATYYMNTEIPRLLKHYNIEDTVENRLAAYNWGVGNLSRSGLDKAPQETVDYIEKYMGL